MSIYAPIPIKGDFFEGLGQGQELMNKFLAAPIERRKMEAEAKKQEAMAKLPFGGQQLSGAAGQIMGLEMVKGLYGENSPQYKQAKETYDLEEKVQNQLIP